MVVIHKLEDGDIGGQNKPTCLIIIVSANILTAVLKTI